MPFTPKNVDEDTAAYDDLIARGLRTVPVTVRGDRIVKGYDRDGLAQIVADARRGQS